MIEVIKLNEAYVEQYRALMLEAYKTEPDAFTSTHDERKALALNWWVNRLQGGDSLFYTVAAFDNEVLLGVVGLELNARQKTKHKARIVGMYVKPDSRGRGVGKKLLSRIIDEAAANEIEILLLTVTQGNDQAISLYESVGFESFGVEPKAIISSGNFLAKNHMWLNVSSYLPA